MHRNVIIKVAVSETNMFGVRMHHSALVYVFHSHLFTIIENVRLDLSF